MLTYLPLELNDNQCIVFLNNNIVRVYDTIPLVDTPIKYTDFYITDHYTFIDGYDSTSELVTCVNHDQFTNNVFYRYDISDILVSFTCIFLCSILLIYFAMKCFFKGLFK